MLLHRSKYVGSFDYDAVVRLASEAIGADREGYRADFIDLVRRPKSVAMTVAARER